ncbi:hypothetical protein ACFXKX_17565 [Streptomyces scopuliridis]|uniref:MmyB family transcriptional regulator n=1 Tax=Streptomyces scopuliridis TaxID=452529 RepID=UPI0036CAF67C
MPESLAAPSAATTCTPPPAAHDATRATEAIMPYPRHSPSRIKQQSRHDVRGRTNGRATIAHPRVGTLTLDLERFLVPSAPGQQLVVYSAESDSRSHEALHLLAELTD